MLTRFKQRAYQHVMQNVAKKFYNGQSGQQQQQESEDAQCQQLEQQIQQASSKISQLEATFRYTLADTENLKRETMHQQQVVAQQAQDAFAESLLDSAVQMESIMRNISELQQPSVQPEIAGSKQVTNLIQGLQMTNAQFLTLYSKHTQLSLQQELQNRRAKLQQEQWKPWQERYQTLVHTLGQRNMRILYACLGLLLLSNIYLYV